MSNLESAQESPVTNGATEPKRPAVLVTCGQIDRKIEKHTPEERRRIMAYLTQTWGQVQ